MGAKCFYHNKPWDLYVFYLPLCSLCGKYDSLGERIPLEKVTQLLHGSTVITLKEKGKIQAVSQAWGLELSLSCIFVSESQDAL